MSVIKFEANSITLNTNEEFSLSSLEFLNNYINPSRLEFGEKEVRNRDFVKRVADELELKLERAKISLVNGNEVKSFDLTLDQMMLVGMRESKSVRRSVLAKLKDLEQKLKQYSVPQTFAEALQLAANQALMIEQQQTQLQLAAPKVETYDKIADATNYMSWNDAAKILGCGRNKMLSMLRNEGIVGLDNVPYQRYLDSELFTVKVRVTGHGNTTKTTYVTGKGLLWLEKTLKSVEFI